MQMSNFEMRVFEMVSESGKFGGPRDAANSLCVNFVMKVWMCGLSFNGVSERVCVRERDTKSVFGKCHKVSVWA